MRWETRRQSENRQRHSSCRQRYRGDRRRRRGLVRSFTHRPVTFAFHPMPGRLGLAAELLSNPHTNPLPTPTHSRSSPAPLPTTPRPDNSLRGPFSRNRRVFGSRSFSLHLTSQKFSRVPSHSFPRNTPSLPVPAPHIPTALRLEDCLFSIPHRHSLDSNPRLPLGDRHSLDHRNTCGHAGYTPREVWEIQKYLKKS
jgi:hypothetical protein